MKPYVLLLFLITLTLSTQAQIDNKKNSISIPAIESKKDSAVISPSIPKKENNVFGINNPKVAPNLELPKKEFSMFPEEEFGNPGELYSNKLDKIEKDLLPEGYGSNGGAKEDVFWGDYYTESSYVLLMVKDHGAIDGDLLRIFVNDDVLVSDIYLNSNFKSYKLDLLNEGVYKIDFYAINEGSMLPNTAAYKILDQWGNVITGVVEGLSEGVKITVNIVKE